jgi:catechol 2,3-dioxygenase-like lactoylglutathione lyase family enzyme
MTDSRLDRSRIQLALNVSDIDAAVGFYTRLLGTGPTKRRPGYANFAVVDPPLKLVLIEDAGARGSGVVGALNHLGIEVGTSSEVTGTSRRLSGEGLVTLDQESTACCYAEQDKVWVHDPDGAPWEVYTVLRDSDVLTPADDPCQSATGCCTPSNPAGHGVPAAPVDVG